MSCGALLDAVSTEGLHACTAWDSYGCHCPLHTDDAACYSHVAAVKTCSYMLSPDQVYNNNGMPLGAAVGIPLGAVATVAALLALAHWQRKRTERCGATFPFHHRCLCRAASTSGRVAWCMTSPAGAFLKHACICTIPYVECNYRRTMSFCMQADRGVLQACVAKYGHAPQAGRGEVLNMHSPASFPACLRC